MSQSVILHPLFDAVAPVWSLPERAMRLRGLTFKLMMNPNRALNRRRKVGNVSPCRDKILRYLECSLINGVFQDGFEDLGVS